MIYRFRIILDAPGDIFRDLEIEATAAGQEQQIINNEGLVRISKIGLAQL